MNILIKYNIPKSTATLYIENYKITKSLTTKKIGNMVKTIVLLQIPKQKSLKDTILTKEIRQSFSELPQNNV